MAGIAADRIQDVIRSAAKSLAASNPVGSAGALGDYTSALRVLLSRALLTTEWGESVDARLSEACAVTGVSADLARASTNAGVGEAFRGAFAEWGVDGAATQVPYLMDSRASLDRQRTGCHLPSDVVESMTDWLAAFAFDAAPRILALQACTGALAGSLVGKVIASGLYSPDDIAGSVRLMDPDPGNLGVACVVVAHALERATTMSPPDVLHAIRSSALVVDAVEWAETNRHQFDLAVGVVPFGATNSSPGGDAEPTSGPSAGDRAAAHAQLLVDVIADDGAASVLMPATIVTAPAGTMGQVRDNLLKRFKTSEFLNFGCEPESILGIDDDVPRSIVRLHASGTGTIVTTPMMRVSASTRSSALTDPRRTTLYGTPPLGQHVFVPRIGSDVERRLVDAVITHANTRWKEAAVELTHGEHRGTPESFSVAAAARDRFSISLPTPRLHFGDRLAATARYAVTLKSDVLVDPALAVMLSRTAFWWWLATGDGQRVRPEHVSEPLSWLRFMDDGELALAAAVAVDWRRLGEDVGGEGNGAAPPPRAVELDRLLVSKLGATDEDARAFVATRNFVEA